MAVGIITKNLDCLLSKTKTLLLNMIDGCAFLEKYVLVDGSALTLHLCRRKSEDLDFFTFEDNFDKKEIFEYLKNFKIKAYQAIIVQKTF